uniref:Bm4912 n=2 Tax=Brugia malayi TaxID=6279 RepID=A0A0H5S6L0_BRUMA|nr:Bm4912 [Brugia malayi]
MEREKMTIIESDRLEQQLQLALCFPLPYIRNYCKVLPLQFCPAEKYYFGFLNYLLINYLHFIAAAMNSIITILLSILFFFNIPSRSLHKHNAHSDKDIISALVMAVSTEQSSVQTQQPHAVPALLKFWGHRKKRNNAYGDEAVPPTAGLTLPMPAPAEQAPAQAGQPYAAIVPAPVESSGYRKKRNNAYGDEAVPPTAGLTLPMPAPAEQAPAQAGQPYAAIVPAPVESSGYRKKRNNAYGDGSFLQLQNWQ